MREDELLAVSASVSPRSDRALLAANLSLSMISELRLCRFPMSMSVSMLLMMAEEFDLLILD